MARSRLGSEPCNSSSRLPSRFRRFRAGRAELAGSAGDPRSASPAPRPEPKPKVYSLFRVGARLQRDNCAPSPSPARRLSCHDSRTDRTRTEAVLPPGRRVNEAARHLEPSGCHLLLHLAPLESPQRATPPCAMFPPPRSSRGSHPRRASSACRTTEGHRRV